MAKPKKERFLLRVVKGGFEPADGFTTKRLKERGYHVGDLLLADLTKARNPGFHRLAHRVGGLCKKNIESFSNLTEHESIKRLQWESGIACDEMSANVPNVGMVPIKIPKSIAFDRMDEGEFQETMKGLCRHICETYWPDLTEEQVQEMAETMPEDI
jgi:hypothetical protein